MTHVDKKASVDKTLSAENKVVQAQKKATRADMRLDQNPFSGAIKDYHTGLKTMCGGLMKRCTPDEFPDDKPRLTNFKMVGGVPAVHMCTLEGCDKTEELARDAQNKYKIKKRFPYCKKCYTVYCCTEHLHKDHLEGDHK